MSTTHWIVITFLSIFLINITGGSQHQELPALEPLPQSQGLKASKVKRSPTITEEPRDVVVVNTDNAVRLYCRANGFPKPTITWLKDGIPLSEASVRDMTMLSPGELLLLRVRNKGPFSNTGIYQCIVSNSLGKVESRNASVQIANIREDFKKNPRDTIGAVGGSATLQCEGPRGFPEPIISWKKDGTIIENKERSQIKSGGDLVINRLEKSDSGVYRCLATNVAGQRTSTGALLMVQEPPRFTILPSNQVVHVGQAVELKCRAAGDPRPRIKWSRKRGTIPQNRLVPVSNGNMRISGVRLADEGEYVCTAENRVGKESASAFIEVQAEPEIVDIASETVVQIGEMVVLKCRVRGKPTPTVIWRDLRGTEMFMENSYQDGHLFVAASGDLVIYKTRFDDQGTFVCQAVNPLATVTGEVQLIVTPRKTNSPPPIITRVPQNITAILDSDVVFHCSSDSVPEADIKWYKDGKLVQSGSDWSRFTKQSSGNLKIHNVKKTDAGCYTCKSTNSHGFSDWNAWLTVYAHGASLPPAVSNGNFPRAPTKPTFVNSTSSRITLTWKPAPHDRGLTIQYYVVEYYRIGSSSSSWRRIEPVTRSVYTADSLLSSSSYVFFVRSINEQGVSEPSQISQRMTTKDLTVATQAETPDPDIGDLAAVMVRLIQAVPLANREDGTWSVRITWATKSGCQELDGFMIVTQAVARSKSKAKQKSVSCLSRTTDLTGLLSGTKYEVRIRPIRDQFVGKPSPIVFLSLQKGIIEADPPILMVSNDLLDARKVLFRWQPPNSLPATYVSRYALTLRSQGGSIERLIHTNASTYELTLNDLPGDTAFLATVTYITDLGDGVTSDERGLFTGQETTAVDEGEGIVVVLQQPAVIAGLCSAVVVVLVIVIIWCCWRARKKRKTRGSCRANATDLFDRSAPFSAGFHITKTVPAGGTALDGRSATDEGDSGHFFYQRSLENTNSNNKNTIVSYSAKNGEIHNHVEEKPTGVAVPTQPKFSYVADQLTSKTDIPPQFARPVYMSDQQTSTQHLPQPLSRQMSQNISACSGTNTSEPYSRYLSNCDDSYAYFRYVGSLPPPPPSPPLSQRTAISDRSRTSSGKHSTDDRSSRSGQRSKRSVRSNRSESVSSVGHLATNPTMQVSKHSCSPTRTEERFGNISHIPPTQLPTSGMSSFQFPSAIRNRQTPNFGYLVGPAPGKTNTETRSKDVLALRGYHHSHDPRDSVAVSNLSMMNGYDSASDIRESSCDEDSPASLSSDEESFSMESASQVGQRLIPCEAEIQADAQACSLQSGPKKSFKKHPTNTYPHHLRGEILLEENSGDILTSTAMLKSNRRPGENIPGPRPSNKHINRTQSRNSSSSSYHQNTVDSGMSAGAGCSTEHSSLTSSSSAGSAGGRRKTNLVNRSRMAGSVSLKQNFGCNSTFQSGSALPEMDLVTNGDVAENRNMELHSPVSPPPCSASELSGYMSNTSSASPLRHPYEQISQPVHPSNGHLTGIQLHARPSKLSDSTTYHDKKISSQSCLDSVETTPYFSEYDVTPTNNLLPYGDAVLPETVLLRNDKLSDVPEVSTSDFCEDYSDQSQ